MVSPAADKVELALNAEDIMITQKGSAPEIGQIIPPYTDEFEYQGLELEGYMEKLTNYELVSVLDIEGKTDISNQFVEFYPNESSVKEIVIDCFYKEK